MIYTADFETTTDENDCRVWAWAILSIDEKEYYEGENIAYFFETVKILNNSDVYFHNLKFDGTFLLNYLFKEGYEYSTNREPKTFNSLISDMNQFYSIDVTFSRARKKRHFVKFYDSAKIIPLKIAEIPKAFGLDIEKLEIDYGAERKEDHKATETEKAYLRRDVTIAARALRKFFEMGLSGMTIGSMSLKFFKQTQSADWQKLFPMTKELDDILRQAYKGAFTYVKKEEEGKDQGEGLVFDVNSLYPYVMYSCKLPYGEPVYFEGEYRKNNVYDWYIQFFECSFKLKKEKLPTLQLKNNYSFIPTEYIETSKGETIQLCMTRTDIELFMEHYEVENLTFHCGYKFKSKVGIFKDYIDYWINIKNESTINGNKGMRTIAKLFLNNLYGKFSSRPTGRSKIPYYEDGQVKYRLGDEEERRIMYIPIGAAITAYAREKTIRAAQANYERFIYADTDSLHLKGTEIPDNIEVDSVKLGAWKHESTFTRARFLRAKSYIEEIDGEIKVTCAGLPANSHKYVTWDNFRIGAEYEGKLQQKSVKGGIILKETTFRIKK